MTYISPNLQLKTYDLTTDGTTLVSQYINDTSGSTITSDMLKIDTWAGDTNASMVKVTASAVILSASVITAGSYTQVLVNNRGQVISASVTPARNGNIWMPATGMFPSLTNGCAPLRKIQMASSGFNILVMDFSGSLVQYCEASLKMPDDWKGTPLTASFVWQHSASSVGYGVVWGIMGSSLIDGQSINYSQYNRYGTSASWVEAPDVGGSASTVYITGSTPYFNVASGSVRTPAGGDICQFIIRRSASAVNDTSDLDAGLWGVSITYERKL